MKILSICNLPPPYGGAEVFSKELASSLSKAGENIVIITQKMYEAQSTTGFDVINYPYLQKRQLDLIDQGIKIFPLFLTPALKGISKKKRPPIDRKLVQNLEKVVLEERSEVIHCHFTTKTIQEALNISKTKKIPLVVTLHGITNLIPFADSGAMGGLSTEEIISMLKSCAQTTVVSQPSLDFCLSFGLQNVCKIPCGIDRELFSLGTHKDRRGILYVGKLNMLKGLKETLIAFLKVANTIEENLYLVGRGIDENAFRKTGFFLDTGEKMKFLELKNQGRIFLLGELDPVDLRDLYWSKKILVLPSVTEGFPLAVLEALSCGMPVIASDVGSISEVIQDGKNGYLIPKANSTELAQAMVRLVSEYDSDIRYVCRESTVHYDINQIAQDYINLFHTVINESKS